MTPPFDLDEELRRLKAAAQRGDDVMKDAEALSRAQDENVEPVAFEQKTDPFSELELDEMLADLKKKSGKKNEPPASTVGDGTYSRFRK